MARTWKSRPASPPTSITECARRYHACAVALSQSLGLSLADTLATHRESVTAIYIETSRCDLRLPAGVTLPPLAGPVVPPNGQGEEISSNAPVPQPVGEPANGDAPPTTIPTGSQLPCEGKGIAALRPAQLALLLAKVDRLAAEKGSAWRPLLEALVAERQARVTQGQRPKPTLVAGDGQGA
jgi:hypothetical protein